MHFSVLFPNNVPWIALGVETFAVHIPKDADGFLAFSLALKDGRLATTSRLVLKFDLKLRRCLDADENDGRQSGSDAVGRLAEVITFARLLDVADGQSAVLDADVVV